ncbi:hypothetical protein B484DRAFT_313134, partial [Ochromonadaceae sp. CCMP2298]
VYSFELFSAEFCELLLAEVDACEQSGLPKRRPNTMNAYGIVLNDFGFAELMSRLLEDCLRPLAEALYPTEVVASSLDHHHSFVVEYKAAEAAKQSAPACLCAEKKAPKGGAGLDMHIDSSEVTLNVCLGRAGFQASQLTFCGRAGAPDHRSSVCCKHKHTIGTGVLHLGRHRHGADDITSGERCNLIVWARSS